MKKISHSRREFLTTTSKASLALGIGGSFIGSGLLSSCKTSQSSGNNPFICRTIWRRDRRSECFIVTSKKSYYDENEP